MIVYKDILQYNEETRSYRKDQSLDSCICGIFVEELIGERPNHINVVISTSLLTTQSYPMKVVCSQDRGDIYLEDEFCYLHDLYPDAENLIRDNFEDDDEVWITINQED